MKLHLPVMLRRSLLALIALLSPAVVTTTLATATLAAISVPVLADDLTLNGTYEFSGSVTFDSVITSSADDVIKATAINATFTADTIKVNAGHSLDVTSYRIGRTMKLYAAAIHTEHGSTISINGAESDLYATETLYDLFNNMADKSLIVKGNSSLRMSITGAGHADLTTSDLIKKIDFVNTAGPEDSYVRCKLNITEGNLTIDSDLNVNEGLQYSLSIGDDTTGTATAIITQQVTEFTTALYVESDGELKIDSANTALTIDYVDVSGEMESNRDLVLNYAYFYTDSAVTLNGNTTIEVECENEGTMTTSGKLSVKEGSSLTLIRGSVLNLGEVIENHGTVTLDDNCLINVVSSDYSDEYISHVYDDGDNGYLEGSTYTVITGTGTLTGRAFWAVDGMRAGVTYADGKVTVMYTTPDTSVYYVRNGDVDYTKSLAQPNAVFSLEGGHLQLNETLLDTQSIVSKNEHSWVCLKDEAVQLKSSLISLDGAEFVTLQAADGGTYIIDKVVDGIVELTLGTGVKLAEGLWWGTVKTNGDTTVSANVDTTGWNKTELNGITTVKSGVTLTLGGNSTLGGKITNNGTLVLGGTITVNKDTFNPDDAVVEVTGYFIGSSTTPNSTNSGFEAACWDITIAEGGTITDNGASWKLVGDENATFDFAADGTLHAYGSGVGTVFHVAEGDSITYSESNAADFVNSKGEAATAIQLNGGTLELQSALDTTVKSAAASAVVITESVNLNAGQLDASAAAVTLSGKGCYTLGADANALNTGVGLGNDWSGTVKLTGAADALELSSLGNALSSIDLGSFNHTLSNGEHVIDSALMGSGTLALNEGSKLTLNGDCSNWSGDIIGQVKLELTEGGIISGNVQVDSLHIGEGSSTTVDGNLTTTGTITVTDNATLSLNGNTTLGGTIESADSATVELAGQITVDVETFESSTVVKDVTGYFIGSNTTPNSTNSGFEAACWDITIAEGGTITDNGATWKLVGDENATFDFAADGTLHAYGSGVGTVFHVAEGDSITYSESNAADFVNSKGEAVTAIQLNGGTLELQSALDTTVKSAAASSVVVAEGVNLNADQLDTSAADVTLRGVGSYSMQGQELSGVVELNSGVALDANEWKGTVYTGSMAQSSALDITALGNSQSTVWLGSQPMSRSMPGETVLESLTAAGVGTTVVPGSLTLQKGNSTAGALEMGGILTLGTADTAASLVADSVSLQGLSFAHADSTLVTGKLEGAETLNVQLTDEVLSKKEAGETITLVTLKEGFNGALTLNGSEETERVRSEDNRKEYTLAWNEDGTALTLSILGTETYVDEQVKPESSNSRAAVTMLTDVFLNSRPQKDAPGGALAGILNAVDAGVATDRDMAAVAGASTAALGMALRGDVERQLNAIRNRSVAENGANSITLASEKSGKQTGSRFFAWVNAEGNRAEQDADSTAAGYTLTSWGGTLGAGMQVNDKLTLGLALTAMYGDLQSDAPDYLKGDMDTTYVSAFARYNRGRWSHAFIGTVGTMEADYKRTVSHAAGGYNTSGDTDGTAFGLMYEVSRSMKLSNRSTLSPVFNISYRHTEVDSYSESGADAALNVGKQSMDTVTAGAGARYAAVVGQRMLNRACGFEARALVKYDLGDRQSTASVGFAGQATRADIEGAEMGAFGVELGAGISVPVGSGSIFADGAVELRSDYTNYNATVGYRIQF